MVERFAMPGLLLVGLSLGTGLAVLIAEGGMAAAATLIALL